ncbi:MAG: hypothetical protein V4544_00165 [Pseudomonadota bacterium]
MKKYLLALLALFISHLFLEAAEYKESIEDYLFLDSCGEAPSHEHFEFFFSKKEITQKDEITESDIKFEVDHIKGFLKHFDLTNARDCKNRESMLNALDKVRHKYKGILDYLKNCAPSELTFSWGDIAISSSNGGGGKYSSSDFMQKKGCLYFFKKNLLDKDNHFFTRVNIADQESIGDITTESLKQWQINKLERQMVNFEQSISFFTFESLEKNVLERLKAASNGYKISLNNKNIHNIICYNRELDSLFTGMLSGLRDNFLTICMTHESVYHFYSNITQ